MPKIIGIGGCSRSGKSSLAKNIKKHLANKRVLLLDTDDFVFSATQIPKIKDRTDWERPESVDFERLCQTINDKKDQYDVLVIEGILVFANEHLLNLFDTTVQIEISQKTFLARRKHESRWGEEPNWFIDYVWESYLRYGLFPKADFTFSGEEEIHQTALSEILDFP